MKIWLQSDISLQSYHDLGFCYKEDKFHFLFQLLTFLLRYPNDLKTTSKGLGKFGRVGRIKK